MNPFDPIFFHAALNPRRPAIAYPEGLATFGMLAESANKAAGNLIEMGLKRGDRIAVEIRDPFLHFIIAMAISRIGAVGVSLATDALIDLSPFNIAASLVDQTSRVPRPRHRVVDNAFFLESRITPIYATQIRGADFAPEDLWRIAFSSGTTGRAKALGYTAAIAEKRLTPFNVGENSGAVRCLSMMGFSSPWGVGSVLSTLRNGGLATFAPTPDQALDIISFYSVGALIVSPAQLADLVNVQRVARRSVPSLRSITVGGARLPRDILIDAQRLLCSDIQINYGSSETGRVSAMNANVALEIEGAVGYVFPWLNVEIERADGRRCSFGEEGRLRISGEGVLTNYIEGPGPAAPSSISDWFYPGDLATMRMDGLLIITGRDGYRINRQGMKFDPETVEEQLDRDPGVRESCVCGFETKTGATIMVAGLVLQPGIDLEAVIASLRTHMTPAQMPDDFVVLESIPRGMLGKIERESARGLISAAYAQD